ncbi:hypothetical protein EI541_07425 [Xanthomonas citri pv. eucalyptorum]|nr:hypothetical protein EI541_07425 [Xanthomonas axonopodis pv. eucalyptorum]
MGDIEQIAPPTPISGALQLAVLEVMAKNAQNSLHEEEVTTLIWGSSLGAVSWFSTAFCDFPTPGFDWGQYNKYGKQPNSEGSTGADFCLLIRFSEAHARAAILQAKQAISKDQIGVHRVSPLREAEKKLPEPQILRLVDHGVARLSAIGVANTNHAALDWVHYCGYWTTSFFCIPLSSVEDVILGYKRSKESVQKTLSKRYEEMAHLPSRSRAILREAVNLWQAHEHDTIERNSSTKELVHLLALGASTPWDNLCPGWLHLEGKDAIEDFATSTSTLMQVMTVNAGHSPEPSTDPAPDAAPSGPAHTRSAVGFANQQRSQLDTTPYNTPRPPSARASSGTALTRKR